MIVAEDYLMELLPVKIEIKNRDLENRLREEIKEKIRIGREQINRAEGIPDHALPSHLAKLKAKRKLPL